MSNWQIGPPQLIAISQCTKGLDFSPLAHWPQGLPAVAINKLIIAGFNQDLAFNHEVELNQTDTMVKIFRSLYSDLSLAEIARLCQRAQQIEKFATWFPLEPLISAFGLQPSAFFYQVIDAIQSLPIPMQNWCAEKKLGAQDFAPLLAAKGLDLSQLWQNVVSLSFSRSQTVLALELVVDLFLLGRTAKEIGLEKMAWRAEVDPWIESLKVHRFPETYRRDQQTEAKMKELPWPGTGQARWARQGDRAGIELKLFVSQPSDLKKYIQSLRQIQELLENETDMKTSH